jgi:cytoskeleton protein RodZ
MSEVETLAAPGQAQEASAPIGFGRRLAAERERLGLSVGDIAGRLRLHPKQVQAIESESLPGLPAPFLRGFVRNYAKEVRLDPAPLLDQLNELLGPRAAPAGERTLAGARGSSAPLDEQVSRRVVLVGVVVALIVFGVVGWMATRSRTPARDVPTAPPTAAPVVPPPPVPEQREAAAVAPAADPVPPSPPIATPAAPPTAGAAGALRLRFAEAAWVEVTQADGRIVHSQINEAGTEQRIDAAGPLRLVVGNASAVTIEFRGKPIDLKPVTSPDNVARITLANPR